jgi:hypothetical protein
MRLRTLVFASGLAYLPVHPTLIFSTSKATSWTTRWMCAALLFGVVFVTDFVADFGFYRAILNP